MQDDQPPKPIQVQPLDVLYTVPKNSPAVKKGEAKNAQVHVHGVTKRHDIKIWPRKHLQYRHFCAFIFYMLHIITSS